MAFCAECGKSNVEQATVCDGCGKPMRSAGRGGAARFKGTMIMGGVAPKAAPEPTPTPAVAPSAAQQPNLAFQATMMGPMTAPGSSAPPPAAGSVPPAAVPTAPAAPRVSPKGTMIGGMGGLQIPPAPAAPEVAASAAPAFQQTPDSSASAGAASTDQSQAAPSLEIDYGGQGNYGGYGAPANTNKTWLWIALGIIGALAFACVGTGLAVYFGAISFGDDAADTVETAPAADAPH